MRLAIPLAIVIMISLTIHSIGLVETLFPDHIEYELIEDSKKTYISTTLYNLRYTGFNYVNKGKIKGGYYYYFLGKTCHFVVLAPDNNGSFADSIDSVTVTGKVTQSLEELHDLTTMLADEIKWNAADLSDICSNKILNQTLYHRKMSKMILYTMCLLLAISLGNLIFLLLGLVFPYISLATLRRGNYFKLRKDLISAQKELDGGVRYSGNNMFITDNYFINMSLRNVVVIPLEQIVWMYYHSVLHKKIFFKHTIKNIQHFACILCHFWILCSIIRSAHFDEPLQKFSSVADIVKLFYISINKFL